MKLARAKEREAMVTKTTTIGVMTLKFMVDFFFVFVAWEFYRRILRGKIIEMKIDCNSFSPYRNDRRSLTNR